MTNGRSATPTAQANAQTWGRGEFFDEYHTRDLRPVEVDVFLRYHEDLTGRVLELGCGAGRVTGYLAEMAHEVHAIDMSPVMLDYSRKTWPQVTFHKRDITELDDFETGSFDAILAPCNMLDVLTDAERRAELDELHRLLADDGLLFMSSHNRGYVPNLRTPRMVNTRRPRAFVDDVRKLRMRERNRRRLLPLEEHRDDYEIINDGAYDFTLLHYFVFRDAQERQFSEHGFELLECMDLEGRPVGPGEKAPDVVELHYVARARSGPGR